MAPLRRLAPREGNMARHSPDSNGAAAAAAPEQRTRVDREPRAPLGWAESRAAGRLLLSGAFLLALLPPLATGWTRRADPLLENVGRQAALLAFSLLALQVVLAARFCLVDRALGLDAAMRLHRRTGLLAFALLLMHPTSLLLASRGRIEWSWQVALGPA